MGRYSVYLAVPDSHGRTSGSSTIRGSPGSGVDRFPKLIEGVLGGVQGGVGCNPQDGSERIHTLRGDGGLPCHVCPVWMGNIDDSPYYRNGSRDDIHGR